MSGRAPDEHHRAATPLELFFDLVFVVAIAQAASWLHHEMAADHASAAILPYGMVFFAIWWAWMNFTWFASAYDTDDVPYRIAALVQMAGALVLAAGVPAALESGDFAIVAGGYVLMRLALVAQWLRAARDDPPRRRTALRYATGISLVQVAWVGWLFVPQGLGVTGFFVLAAVELAIPIWAERAGPTCWHPEHIVERYGLLMIIVLGETILAATLAIRTAIADRSSLAQLAPVCVGGLSIVFSLWWLYFARPQENLRHSARRAFIWGYGHLLLYASGAAIGAGLAAAIDARTGHAAIDGAAAGQAVAVPVALFLLVLWALHARPGRDGWLRALSAPLVAALVLLAPATPMPVVSIGILTSALLAAKILGSRPAPEPPAA